MLKWLSKYVLQKQICDRELYELHCQHSEQAGRRWGGALLGSSGDSGDSPGSCHHPSVVRYLRWRQRNATFQSEVGEEKHATCPHPGSRPWASDPCCRNSLPWTPGTPQGPGQVLLLLCGFRPLNAPKPPGSPLLSLTSHCSPACPRPRLTHC